MFLLMGELYIEKEIFWFVLDFYISIFLVVIVKYSCIFKKGCIYFFKKESVKILGEILGFFLNGN